MEEESSKPIDDDHNFNCKPEEEEEIFFDALDEFPFFDSLESSTPVESSIQDRRSGVDDDDVVIESSITNSSNQEGLPRRTSFRSKDFTSTWKEIMPKQPKDDILSTTSQISSPRERKNEISSGVKEDDDKVNQVSDPPPQLESISMSVEAVQIQESSSITSESRDLPADDLDNRSSVLVLLAGLVIKAVGIQINLLVKFFTFPIWVSYCSFLFLSDPFGVTKRVKKLVIEKLTQLWGVAFEILTDKLKGYKSYGKFALKFGWGFFWSVYVCFMLVWFLISGFVIAGVSMRYVVEEPIRMTESLNFDYTKSSPVALFPIMSCPSVSCGVDCKESFGELIGVRHSIPPNHKLQVTVSLTLPESEYNRNLGVFQVRIDFLSERGEVTASSKHPCMLRFKSRIIRYIETLLKSVPLLAGYSAEAQDIFIKMKGFTEGHRPTSCLRVILEQRAEYKSGAGIPEIYAASLVLESELPLFKRILWYWKRTVYIWISMVIFTMEVIFALLCCRPILLPRAWSQGSANSNNQQITIAPVRRS